MAATEAWDAARYEYQVSVPPPQYVSSISTTDDEAKEAAFDALEPSYRNTNVNLNHAKIGFDEGWAAALKWLRSHVRRAVGLDGRALLAPLHRHLGR
jgi:hypothetical protein